MARPSDCLSNTFSPGPQIRRSINKLPPMPASYDINDGEIRFIYTHPRLREMKHARSNEWDAAAIAR